MGVSWRRLFVVLSPPLIGIGSVLLFQFAAPDFFLPMELKTIDYRFRWRGPTEMYPGLLALDLDSESARRYVPPERQPWPWPRQMHGKIVDLLTELGTKAILFDIWFPNPRPEEDGSFITAVRRSGRVHLAVGLPPPRKGEGLLEAPPEWRHSLLRFSPTGYVGAPKAGPAKGFHTFPGLVAAAKGIGHINRAVDPDGILRRLPLVVEARAGHYPGLAFGGLLSFLEVDRDSLEVEWGRAISFKARDDTGRERITRIPVDSIGRMAINFTGPWGDDPSRHISYRELIENSQTAEGKEALRKRFSNAIVVVANLTEAAQDRGPTPFDEDYLFGELHLNVLHTILSGQFLRDYATGSWRYDSGVMWVNLAALLLTTGLLTVVAERVGPLFIGIFGGVIEGAYLAAALYTFSSHGIVLPLLTPLAATFITLVLLLMHRLGRVEAESRFFADTLGRYFPPQLVSRFSSEREKLLSWQQRLELSVLFSDIQGFTAFSDRQDPAEIKKVLGEYFDAMTNIVFEYGGTVDKFMGDGLMAFFGFSPEVPGPEQMDAMVREGAVAAAKAAVVMQQKVGELNRKWGSEGRESQRVRIGLNTGFVTVGNMGGSRRMDFTVLGSEVNKAQRFESNAPAGGLLLGKKTFYLAREALPVQIRERAVSKFVTVKNIADPIEVFEITDLDKE